MVARSWAIGTASTARAAPVANSRCGERLDARGARPLADADGQHARGEHEHVAALEPRAGLLRAAVEELRAGEARVVAVDRAGERRLAPARTACASSVDGDAVLEPHARVAREQQVGQRADDEVERRRHAVDEPAGHRQLGRGPCRRSARRRARRRRAPSGARRSVARERRPDRLRPQRAGQRMLARGRHVERLGEQLAQVEHLHAAGRAAPAANASCSSCARSTHGTPSNSSSSLLRGVSRRSSSPGRCSITVRSGPTSLPTPCRPVLIGATLPPRVSASRRARRRVRPHARRRAARRRRPRRAAARPPARRRARR